MKTILAVDDEPTMLKSLENGLTAHGYALVATRDPAEAVRIFRDRPDVCLVLLDIRMPGKDGFEIYREMRRHRKTPVLFVTAYPKSFTTESDELLRMWREEFSDGTTDILYKPFGLAALVEKVGGLIGQAQEEAVP